MTTNYVSKADKIFIENIQDILNNGTSTVGHKIRPIYKDGTPAHTIYVNQVVEKYDISKGEFPITTLRPIAIKSAIKEILWIYQDQSNDLSVLEEKHNIMWWRDWEVDNTNTNAISFYKSKGYSIIGYDKLAYTIDGDTMPVYMGKRL